jgi:AcrR family transcriptional regulator
VAKQLFSKRGYSECGIRDIAAGLGLSSTILLRYFESKAGLFEAALRDALGAGQVFPPRGEYGAFIAGLLTDPNLDMNPHAMCVLATANEEAREIVARVLHEHAVEPLAAWLGPPDAKARAQQILALCSGFVLHTLQLTRVGRRGRPTPSMVHWLAQSVQAVVDGGVNGNSDLEPETGMQNPGEPKAVNEPLYSRRVDSFRGKSLEANIQTLADREEIRDLVATYAHRMAHGPAAADLFTDDGVYVNRGTPNLPAKEVRGRAALDRHFCDRTAWAERPLPMIHNHLIAVRGDEATGICSVEIRLAAEGASIVASGYYNDRYRREYGRWRFVERDAYFFHWVPLDHGWAKPTRSS